MQLGAAGFADRVKSVCAKIGRDPLLVQGAGGNISWKEDGVLWVKASGTRLADAERKSIFVPIDLRELQASIATGSFSVAPRVMDASSLRPSIETLLHALMPRRVVAHLHAIEILAHLVRRQPELRIKALIKDAVCWTCVDYCKPGADLAKAVAKKIASCPRTDVVFLRNHGVVLGGDDVESIESTLNFLVTAMRNKVVYRHFDDVRSSDATSSGQTELLRARGYGLCRDRVVSQLAINNVLSKRLRSAWALYPDHPVFLGRRAVLLRNGVPIPRFSELARKPPFVFVLGRGVFQSKHATASHLAQLRCYYDVLARQAPTERLHALSEGEVSELLSWEAERYQQRSTDGRRSAT